MNAHALPPDDQPEGRSPTGRPAIEDLIPGYVLGAADAGEGAAILRRAAEDPAVAAELAAYTDLADSLLLAVPSAVAPVGLAASLRAALDAPAGSAAATQPTPAQPTPAATPAVPATGAATGAATIPAPVLPAPAPLVTPPAAPLSATPGRRWHWPLLALAAAVALLFLLNLLWLRELFALRESQLTLSQQLDVQTAQLTQQQAQSNAQAAQLTEQDNLLAALVNDQGERYVMNAVQPGSDAVARVAWLADSKLAVLRAEQLPKLDPGKVYQMWLIRPDGQRESAGVFQVNDQGCGTLVFTPDESLDNFAGMGITPEPDGGSPGPTGQPVLRTQL